MSQLFRECHNFSESVTTFQKVSQHIRTSRIMSQHVTLSHHEFAYYCVGQVWFTYNEVFTFLPEWTNIANNNWRKENFGQWFCQGFDPSIHSGSEKWVNPSMTSHCRDIWLVINVLLLLYNCDVIFGLQWSQNRFGTSAIAGL